jgi:hypothetical protein
MLWQPTTGVNDGEADSWIFQSDGKLFVYNAANQAVWASEWNSKEPRIPGSLLIMSTTDVMIQTSVGNQIIWSIGTIDPNCVQSSSIGNSIPIDVNRRLGQG